MEVYVVINESVYDGNCVVSTNIFSTIEKARKELRLLVSAEKEFIEDERERWGNDWTIDEDTDMIFRSHYIGYYSHYHTNIWIEKRKVL